MKIGALVPARIGSKRVPRKNIKLFGDKPLICWTLDTLLEADVFDCITVSTESAEVEEVVKNHYPKNAVEVLHRPDHLAGDNVSLEQVIEHYLDWKTELEVFGLFMPTYPFRRVEKIREAAYAIRSRYAWRVETHTQGVTSSMDYFYPVEDGVKRVFKLHPLYCTSIISTYVFSNRYCHGNRWLKYGITNAERKYVIHADLEEAVDIDTPEDFEAGLKVASGRRILLRKPVTHVIGDWHIITPDGIDIDEFLNYVQKEKLYDTTQPILMLEQARPPLLSFNIMDNSIRIYYMSREANTCFQSSEAKRTGNMQLLPVHYHQSDHYRMLRIPKVDPNHAHRKWPLGCPEEQGFPLGGFHSDTNGLYFGTEFGDEVLPVDRVILMDDLKKQPFYVPPYDYV